MIFGGKKYYFLSGLPRSGNTLLGSILNQNKNICVTANSPVADVFYEIENLKNNDPKFVNFPDTKSIDNISKKIFCNYYRDWKFKYIIDRSCWGTPDNLELLKKYCPNEIKVVVLIRDLNEILASFLYWSENNKGNFLEEFNTTEKKCEVLMDSNGQIMKSLHSLYNLNKSENKRHALFVKYEDLVSDTENKINEIYKFLGIKKYHHQLENISNFKSNEIEYNDIVFGRNLHRVKSKIKKTEYNYQDYVPKSIIEKYKNYNSLYLSLK